MNEAQALGLGPHFDPSRGIGVGVRSWTLRTSTPPSPLSRPNILTAWRGPVKACPVIRSEEPFEGGAFFIGPLPVSSFPLPVSFLVVVRGGRDQL